MDKQPEYLLDEEGTHWVMVNGQTGHWDENQLKDFIKSFTWGESWPPEIGLEYTDTVLMKPGPEEEFKYEGRWYKIEPGTDAPNNSEYFFEFEEVETDWVCPSE